MKEDKNNWFSNIDFNPFHFKRTSYQPHYDDSADYNTNSKSYYDYLARINKILEMFKMFIIRLLNRDVKVTNTSTIKLTKKGNWIDNGNGDLPNNYDDDITISADVQVSKVNSNVTVGEVVYGVTNALESKSDGLFSPDYTSIIEGFKGTGGTQLDYSVELEQRTYSNLQSAPFNIINGSENKSESVIHELWSPEYDNVLKSVDNHVGILYSRISDLQRDLDSIDRTPVEPDFGDILDTMLTKQNIFYTYKNNLGVEPSSGTAPPFLLNVSANIVNLAYGKQDIIVSFTPVLNNTSKYEIVEVTLMENTNGTVSRYKLNTQTLTAIQNVKNVTSGERKYFRLSDVIESPTYNFSSRSPILVPKIRNKETLAEYFPWQLDGTKDFPQGTSDMNNLDFYMKDVEVRIINQLAE